MKKVRHIIDTIICILVAILILGVNGGVVAVNGSNVASQDNENVNEVCVEVETPDENHLLGDSDGKNDFSKYIEWYGYKYKLWLDHDTTQDIIDVTGGAAIISGIIAGTVSGVGAPVAAIFAGVLAGESLLLDRCDEGQGVKVTLHVSWNGQILYQNMDGQDEDDDWWPWSDDIPVRTSVGGPV